MDPFTVAMIGTAIVGAYSSYQAGQQQQQAYEAQAREQERLARLIMDDFEANKKITRRKGDVFIKQQQSAYAGAGVDATTGSPLLAMEDSVSAIQEQISVDRRAALAEANRALAGADVARQTGKAASSAAGWQAAGQLGQGIARTM